MQESAATLLRGGAEQGEEPGRSPGPPSRDTGERGTALGNDESSDDLLEGVSGVGRDPTTTTNHAEWFEGEHAAQRRQAIK